MWSVVLKILSILGIILLCLLGILLLVLLLVLFMPVVYRGGGKAHDGEYRAWFRFRWLFVQLCGEFAYPKNRSLRLKILGIKVFDSSGKRKPERKESRETEPSAAEHPPETAMEITEETGKAAEKTGKAGKAAAEATEEAAANHTEKMGQELREQNGKKDNSAEVRKPAKEEQSASSGWRNRLQHYLSIVQDQNNQDLVKHALRRLGKIIKSIRPRMLRAEGVVGLGEPDTTGYLYGAYWSVKPFLGKKCRIEITPDFERQIFEGRAVLRGRFVTAVLLYHALRILLDKRLRELIDRLRDNK